MEYQKMINLLDNTPNQATKFMTKTWVEINDDARGTHNTSSQSKCKTSMLKSNSCDGAGTDDAAKRVDEIEKVVIFKNYASFTDCIGQTSNTQIDNAKYIDVVMPMYNLIE